MNPKKIFILSLLLSGALFSAHAETVGDSITYEFAPHWYIQGAFGYQYTIGETKAGELFSPNAQIAFGYQFTPVWGLRMNVNGWQSRAGYAPDEFLSKDQLDAYNALTGGKDLTWKWNYVAPALDVMVDLTNAIGGYKHDRLFHVGITAGIGANIYFNNKEAQEANSILKDAYQIVDQKPYFGYLWEGCYASIMGQAGLTFDFHITDNFNLGLECCGNILNDHYNSKDAQNPDWYINTLLTATYRIGETYKKTIVPKSLEDLPMIDLEPVSEVVVEQTTCTSPGDLMIEITKNADGTFTISKEDEAKIELLGNYLATSDHPVGRVIIRESKTKEGAIVSSMLFIAGEDTFDDEYPYGASLTEVGKALNAEHSTSLMFDDIHIAYLNQNVVTEGRFKAIEAEKETDGQWHNGYVENIYFSINESNITRAESKKIKAIIAYLNTNPEAKIIVHGFADKITGSTRYNLALSQKRAETVKKALIAAGIDSKRIVTHAYGGFIQPIEPIEHNRVCICLSK